MPRRRAPVIALAIAAAALSGGVGVAAAAPAVADDGRAAGDSGNDPGPRRPSRGDGPGVTAGSADDGSRPPGDPCPWWPRPIPQVLPAEGGSSRGNSGLIVPATLIPTTPVPVFGDQRAPAAGPVALPVVPAFTPAAPAAPGNAAPPTVAFPAAPRAVPVAPIARRPSAPAAATAPPARVSPPATRTAPAQGSAVMVQSPPPVRLGYPEELRDADLAKVLATALPGLAAMAGMTALGGLVGYRQARAGYLLRAAGAGRFLR